MTYITPPDFTAFDTLTADQLDILGNDIIALHDGSGFNNAAIPGTALSTSAIKLGYVSRSTAQTGITTEADLTSLTLTVTVPAGGRSIRLSASLHFASSSALTHNEFRFKEGSTLLKATGFSLSNTSNVFTYSGFTILTPSAGSHTYKLTAVADGGGTLQNYGDSTTKYLNEFLIEAI